MRTDIEQATVRLPRDEDYDRASPERPRKGTVIMPRSDKWGNQEGRIPPGRAAELGLVPKLHKVGADSAYLSRKRAVESGKSGDELYADFYGAHDAGRPGPRPAAPQPGGRPTLSAADKLRLLTEAGYTVLPDGRVLPPPAKAQAKAPAPAPAPQARTARTAAKAGARAAAKPAKPAARARKSRAAEAPVRVQTPETGSAGADTLDGFYDELEGLGLGSDEVARSPENGGPEGAAGLPETPVPRVREAADPESVRDGFVPGAGPAPELPDPDGDRVFALARKFARERDEARAAYDELKADYLAAVFPAGADGDLARLREENAALHEVLRQQEAAYAKAAGDLRRLQAELFVLRKEAEARPAVQPSGTVRVRLGEEPQLLHVSGQGTDGEKWQVDLMGHVDFSRTRGECVLSVLDPRYASELLANLAPGDVRLEDGTGAGTACAYFGICDKIYGDPASADFITLFRFRVTGEDRAPGS